VINQILFNGLSQFLLRLRGWRDHKLEFLVVIVLLDEEHEDKL
jgi:hypothetical protein